MAGSGQKASWSDWATPGPQPGATVGGSRRTARPRLSRDQLEDSATTWNTIGVLFVLLAAAGAVAMGIALTPEKVSGGFYSTTEKDSGVGIAIGVGVFVGSLVTILPYFMFSRVMKALADLMPATPTEPDSGTGDAPVAPPVTDVSPSVAPPVSDASPSETITSVGEYPRVAEAYPTTYPAAWEQLAACNPQPQNPEAWLFELCGRIYAGAPAELAAQRIPLDWS